MGQHKNNPKSQLKKEGKLPPKPPGIGAPEARRRLQEAVEMELTRRMSNLYIMPPHKENRRKDES